MNKFFRGISLGVWLLLSHQAMAEIRKVRLTSFADPKDFSQLWSLVNDDIGTSFTAADFGLAEQIEMKGMGFYHLAQMREGKPIEGAGLRLWLTPAGDMIVAEGFLDKANTKSGRYLLKKGLRPFLAKEYLKSAAALHEQQKLVRQSLIGHSDPVEMDFAHEDRWKGQDFQRVFTAQGKRGFHTIRYSHEKRAIVAKEYRSFMQAEELEPVPAVAYKFYEEDYNSPTPSLLESRPVMLKYLNAKVVASAQDPYETITDVEYSLYSNAEMLAQMGAPATMSTWSFQDLATKLSKRQTEMEYVENGFNGPHGLVLDGRYVNVTVHPDFKKAAVDLEFDWLYTDQFSTSRLMTATQEPAIKMSTNLRSRTFKSPEDLLVTPVRDPVHRPTKYINEGADGIQVYWAVNEMMDQLHAMGFTDPKISTDKFQAILYNPDRAFMNNAFYVNDTINFTLYSYNAANFARDNTTIWHELGHGIVERIMGPALGGLSTSGGFDEGVADFFAELMVQATSYQEDFPGREHQRIFNKSLFALSNESHDAGEAFGGVMKEILDAAITQWSEQGVRKTADLLLEGMRFSRNHPKLSEQEWFEKLSFADARGSDVREKGEFAALIEEALRGRNFTADGKDLADFEIMIGSKKLGNDYSNADSLSSFIIGTEQKLDIKVKLVDGADFKFTYPLRVVIQSPYGAMFGLDWINGLDDSAQELIINQSGDEAILPAGFAANCDLIMPGETGCKDMLVFQVFEPNSAKPIAKKRAMFKLDQGGLLSLF